jgi:hypothetical protein
MKDEKEHFFDTNGFAGMFVPSNRQPAEDKSGRQFDYSYPGNGR